MGYALDGGMMYSVSMKVAYEFDGNGVLFEDPSSDIVASFADEVGKIPNAPDGKRWEVCVVVA